MRSESIRELILLSATALVAVACSSSDATAPLPPATLVVMTSTVGTNLGPNSYTLTVIGPAGSQSQSVSANGSLTLSEPPGPYAVALGGLSQNCFADALTGVKVQSETLVSGKATSLRFQILCVSASGSGGTGTIALDVTVISPQAVTTRTVTLDRTRSLTVLGAGSYVFAGVPDGLHLVEPPADTFGGPLVCGLFGGDTVRTVGGATVHVGLQYDCF